MEFGKIQDPEILNQVNWKIPETDPLSLKFLEQNQSQSHELFVGAPAWGHKEWVGKFYPLKTPATKYLYHYSRYFTTIELNTTHYRIPTAEQADKWKGEVPSEFVFCPKVFQGISHERNGLVDMDLHKAWFSFLEKMQPYCGPCFIQLPPHFSYDFKLLLFKFLQSWPSEFRLAIELRHPSWFQDGKVLPALTDYLHSKQIGLVILDVAGRRDLIHTSISTDFTMIRCIGNALHPSDYERVHNWSARLMDWKNKGLSQTYFFMHEPDDILLPEMMVHLEKEAYFKEYFKPLNKGLKESDSQSMKLFD